MIKLKKKLMCVAAMMLAVVPCVSVAACGNGTAESNRKEQASYVNEPSGPLGLYTDLQFSLDGENGKVTASVNNKFTLFPSTVTVNIELYRSDVYREDFTFMSLAASNGVRDLDQGETVSASASTEGKGSYWKARAYYRVDNKPQQEKISETIYCSADGTKAPATKPETEEFYISDFLQENAKRIYSEIPYYHTDYEYNVMNFWNSLNVQLENKEELQIVKDLFGEIKLKEFDLDNKSDDEVNAFHSATLNSVYKSIFKVFAEFENGSKAIIYVYDCASDILNANLFVRYSYFENDGTKKFKNFVALVDGNLQLRLHEAMEVTYRDKNDISNSATEWNDLNDLFYETVYDARWDMVIRRPYFDADGIIQPLKTANIYLTGKQFNEVKTYLGTVRVAELNMDTEIKGIKVSEIFNTEFKYAPNILSVKFANDCSIEVAVNGMYKLATNANIYVHYNDGISEKYYSGIISNELKNSLIDLIKNIYKNRGSL